MQARQPLLLCSTNKEGGVGGVRVRVGGVREAHPPRPPGGAPQL
jgi:hypothetical protein